MGSEAEFAVADAQTLEPFSDSSFDIVYSTYICWFEDLFLSCRNWHRVLKPGGRLLLTTGHPITSCLYETDGVLTVEYDYLHPSPEYFDFDGTPLDRRHGGYQNDEEIVEFFHPVAEVVNAMVQAEFSIRRMGELPDPHTDETGGQLSKLPDLSFDPRRKDRIEEHKTGISYFSLDFLMMGVASGVPQLQVDPEDDERQVGKDCGLFWNQWRWLWSKKRSTF